MVASHIYSNRNVCGCINFSFPVELLHTRIAWIQFFIIRSMNCRNFKRRSDLMEHWLERLNSTSWCNRLRVSLAAAILWHQLVRIDLLQYLWLLFSHPCPSRQIRCYKWSPYVIESLGGKTDGNPKKIPRPPWRNFNIIKLLNYDSLTIIALAYLSWLLIFNKTANNFKASLMANISVNLMQRHLNR